jgi:hypothetical protein
MSSTREDFNAWHGHIFTILFRADIFKTASVKKAHILEAVYRLKIYRRKLKDEGLLDEHTAELAEVREEIEAAALRANIPSDLEGKPPKPPKPPKREYVRVRTSPINHAIWRTWYPEKVPFDLE